MNKAILVTGASGYIGGRLIPRLLEKGERVCVLVRDPARLAGRGWNRQVEVAQGDLLLPETLAEALRGVRSAYYLVHSMASGKEYASRDVAAARNFGMAARDAGVEQVIYLGGLADPDGPTSPHMRSRLDTGAALREAGAPVTEFRAGVIIGPGSISFEMIRYISEQFPVLPGPAWLKNLSQPIAIDDVIRYLLAALETPACRGRILEIGGSEVMTHADSMLRYARARGLRRAFLLLPPVIPAGWVALLVGLLTPVPAVIAAPLIGGLQAPSILREDSARRIFPEIEPMDYGAALRQALALLNPAHVELHADPARRVQSFKQEGFLVDLRQERVEADPGAVFGVLGRLGGRNGWLYADWLWKARGLLDRLAGGPGMRGRPAVLEEGSILDFYRVEVLEPGQRLRLRSELKAPGEGWMEWRLSSEGTLTRLEQTAWFAPRGLGGFLYWHLLGPLHRLVFAGLLRRIGHAAVKATR